MKRRKQLLAGGLVLLFLLSRGGGRSMMPHAREMESMVLMRTMGMDAEGDGVRVTVSSDTQSKGANKEKDPPLVLSNLSGTVSGACLAMQSYGTSYVFYGHVSQLLLGEDMAKTGLRKALDYVERDLEMRLNTALFVVRAGTAAEAMRPGEKEGAPVTERLQAIEDDEGLDSDVMTRSVRDVLSSLNKYGAAFVPAVTIRESREGDGNEGEKGLASSGYAVLKGDGLVGWVDGASAQGINLVMERVQADALEVDVGDGEKMALRVVGADTSVKAVFDGDRLDTLKVNCKVDANLSQAPAGFSDWDTETLERLRSELERLERERLEAVLRRSQELEADFLGLKKQAGLAAPWRWEALESQWDSVFPHMEIQVEVEGKILRSYDTTGGT